MTQWLYDYGLEAFTMLQDLRIKHFAIIDEVELSFSKGLRARSGGSPRVILVNAVGRAALWQG
jgi:DNA repair ATPase RecN